MKTLLLVSFVLFSYGNLCFAQNGNINEVLTSIPTGDNDELNSPIGHPDYLWACAATIKMPDFEDRNNITCLEVVNNKGILVSTRAGDIWCLSPSDLSVLWENKLHSEHINQIKPSPNGNTFAVSYSAAKANFKSVEIRDANNGNLLHAIKRITPYKCGYTAEMLEEVNEKTTLHAWEIAYSPDGSKIAVWYNNHGPNLDCKAIELEEIIIIDTQTGQVKAVREGFIWDFWTKNGVKKEIACGDYFPMTFDPSGNYLYVADCQAMIVKYDARTMRAIKQASIFSQIEKIITVDLGIDLIRHNFPLDEIYCQKDGSLLVTYGGQGVGYIFKVSPDLSSVKLITANQGSEYAQISFSNDGNMAMFNSKSINLYDLNRKRPVFYQTTAGFAGEVARFHPTKQAVLYGWENFIKVIAKVPLSTVYLGQEFTPTGHYITPYNALAIQGSGEILWAFDDYDIYHLYAKENELVTNGWLGTGISPAYDNENTIKKPALLRAKSTEPGNFTIFGGTLRPMTEIELLKSLPEW